MSSTQFEKFYYLGFHRHHVAYNLLLNIIGDAQNFLPLRKGFYFYFN